MSPPPSSTRIGIFNQMWATVGMSDREAITTAIDIIRHAEAQGFASVWIGEHHVLPGLPGTFHGRVPAAEVFLAHVAGLTSRIAVGTGVKILSTNSGRRSAEEMAMLSLLAPERVEFGLGQGLTLPGSPETRAEKATRYRALLAEIIATLRGELPFSLEPCPEVVEKIWVASRDAPTLAFAAEHGLNLVIGQAEISLRQAEYVRRYRAEGGRGEVRGARIAFVAQTMAEAEADCAEATEIYFSNFAYKNYHAQAVADGLLPPTAPTPAERRRQLDVFAGTPDFVAAALNDHIAMTGIDRLDIMPQLPGMAPEAVNRSLALFTAEVRPKLRFPALVEV
ncbi:LLM class flavin-dependent oxidoreductase [Acidisoma sp.]|uniref:LLM class flavin-dependent oxidoreductase n=1 Tax=Acidisoma sp. TaxID=1872115 RepID=UPI003B0076DF